ncbi:MAG TPA: hypothetical protein VM055_05645 [Novosphingobium sp.]|nr:hypothetical protein [Novosphingobium sp.]
MSKTMLALAAGVAASLLALPGAAGARDRADPEAKLARMLEGRVAGEPRDCIYLPRIRSSRIIDRTAIVYEDGATLWVNRPDSGASTLDDDDVQVTDVHGSQLCSIDVVRLHDRSTFFYSGFVGLGEFVPYRKDKSLRR